MKSSWHCLIRAIDTMTQKTIAPVRWEIHVNQDFMLMQGEPRFIQHVKLHRQVPQINLHALDSEFTATIPTRFCAT